MVKVKIYVYEKDDVAKDITSKLAEVLPEKVVKPDDALDEGSRGGVVHDVGDEHLQVAAPDRSGGHPVELGDDG